MPGGVNEVRRSAALIAVLGPGGPPLFPETRMGRVQLGLGKLRGEERKVWERTILAISVTERMIMPDSWRRATQHAVDELGQESVLRLLRKWWPTGDAVTLEESGEQLLKHMIWML